MDVFCLAVELARVGSDVNGSNQPVLARMTHGIALKIEE